MLMMGFFGGFLFFFFALSYNEIRRKEAKSASCLEEQGNILGDSRR